ncbi:ABC transporter substrate-binding protein [Paenibacillus sp. UNC499MF]|uniref:ABC transporter substrate-binding protein n=1 Tax=Paenibacillus sp. UNC499MF TaxID=1502751 RepID=UPI00089FD26E|nr:extracellular solute-binding protein [Paenibacillus sp. UNC499MF]SEG51685.1 multiple sugar transport system substrate-binding protein [Paenibacillus sp. UNC499MF]
MMKKPVWAVFIFAALATSACGAGGRGEAGGTPSKDKPKSKDGKTVVTLSLKNPDPFFQTVEKKFEEKYPDIDLQIQSYKQAGEKWGAGDFEKYVKTTNTALLSGKGADIVELSDLPVDKYVHGKLLANLNEMFDQDKALKKEELNLNILNGMKKKDGGLYTLPTSFYLRTYIGDGDSIKKANVQIDDAKWTWSQFEETAKKVMEKEGGGGKAKRPVFTEDPGVTLQEIIMDRYGELVDPATMKAKFDSPAFTDLLKSIKKMYDEKIMKSETAEGETALFYSAAFLTPQDMVVNPHGQYSNPKLLQKPHAEGAKGGIRIIPADEFAVQAKSSVKAEAWTFLSFLYSKDVQSLQDLKGFSLLKEVNDKKLDEIQKQLKGGTFKLPTGTKANVSDDQFNLYKEFIRKAESFSAFDMKVLSIINEETPAYFSGQKPAEEVAKLIQNRVTTYLNE